MARPAYSKIFLSPNAMRQLAALPDEVSGCLTEAFGFIRDRKLSLDPPVRRDFPFTARACTHIIYVSVVPDKNEIAILGMALDVDFGQVGP